MNEKTRKVLHSSKKSDWGTPLKLFETWSVRWGPFTMDPATSPDNPLGTPYFFTEEDDGLKRGWFGNVFVNPPYGRGVTKKWLAKAVEEWQVGNAHIIVMLLPARTDTKWFHEYVLPYAEIIFLPGWIKFVGAKGPAPFPSMLVIYR